MKFQIFGLAGFGLDLIGATPLKGDADLILKTHQDGAFTGKLKVFVAKNCIENPVRGAICDYHFQRVFTDLESDREYTFRLPDQIDAGYDQLLFTYRSQDEAIFDKMELKVHVHNDDTDAEVIVDLMDLDGGGEEHSVFDYDDKDYPCNSSYPRNSKCRFDTIYDLYLRKVIKDMSLFSGHVVDNKQVMPYISSLKPRQNLSSIHFKVGDGNGSGTNGHLDIYYGTRCEHHTCHYTKESSVILRDKGVTYEFYLPDFDYNKDQLIMDFRSSDELDLDELSFNACKDNGSCLSYNLFAFGNGGKLAFDYDRPEHPCSGRYGEYECVYDAVFDFKTKQLFTDRSVLIEQ